MAGLIGWVVTMQGWEMVKFIKTVIFKIQTENIFIKLSLPTFDRLPVSFWLIHNKPTIDIKVFQ